MTSPESELYQAPEGTFELLTSRTERIWGDSNTLGCLDAILLPDQETARVDLRVNEPDETDVSTTAHFGNWSRFYSFKIGSDNTIDLATYQGSRFQSSFIGHARSIIPLPSIETILTLANQIISTEGQIPESLIRSLVLDPPTTAAD